MSDYYHGYKMQTCPRESCNGEDCDRRKHNFKCSECGLVYP